MRSLSAGSRVWIKNGNELQFGVIETIGSWNGYFKVEGSLVIRLDGGNGVVATTMPARGTTWDVVSGKGKQEQV
jgi:hypothetical protein